MNLAPLDNQLAETSKNLISLNNNRRVYLHNWSLISTIIMLLSAIKRIKKFPILLILVYIV
jgi:hypothetical protein